MLGNIGFGLTFGQHLHLELYLGKYLAAIAYVCDCDFINTRCRIGMFNTLSNHFLGSITKIPVAGAHRNRTEIEIRVPFQCFINGLHPFSRTLRIASKAFEVTYDKS